MDVCLGGELIFLSLKPFVVTHCGILIRFPYNNAIDHALSIKIEERVVSRPDLISGDKM